jgi:Chaperone of endosialidase
MKHTSILLSVLALTLSPLSAQVPGLISYQGYVTDTSGAPLGGSVTTPAPVNRTVTFRLWNNSTATASTNRLYSETQPVTISAGDFSVLVGSGTLIESSSSLGSVTLPTECYLGVTVDDGNNSTVDPEISPRQRIVSTAFTLRAKLAETVAPGAVTDAMLANATITGAKIADATIMNVDIASNAAIADTKLANITTAGKVANSATTATSATPISENMANTIVLRDGSGNFRAGTITANLTGTATSASTLTAVLPISLGGTGSATQTFVDLTTTQSIAGNKTLTGASSFTSTASFTGSANIGPSNGTGSLNVGSLTSDHLAMNHNNISAYASPGTTPGTLNLNHAGGYVELGAGSPVGTVNGIRLGKTTGTASRFIGIGDGTVTFAANSGFSGIEFGGPANNASSTVALSTPFGGTQTFVNSGYLAFHTSSSSTSSAERMRITAAGNVGIGTTQPLQAKLVVSGAAVPFVALTNYAYFIGGGVDGLWKTATIGNPAISIYATHEIAASAYRSFSDERIKTIQGVSNATSDLQTLLQIPVTDYRYKDTLANGRTEFKKVIAQQVEKVFPQAVSKQVGVVPDIFKKAVYADGWIMLRTDLKVGERVRLLDNQNHESIEAVIEIADGKFRTAFKPAKDQVFVYGREVKDFRTVDYEAISMLNVSATQEIARRLEAKSAEVEALEERVKKLEARDKARDAKLAALERLLISADKPAARTASLKKTADGAE